MEDAERALEELKTNLTRRIEEKEYNFLLNIYNGNKERIENKEMLLEMLQHLWCLNIMESDGIMCILWLLNFLENRG